MPKKSKKKDEPKAAQRKPKRPGRSLGKDLREAAEPVIRLAENPLVGDLVAGAVLAGVEAFLGGEGGKQAKAAASNAVEETKAGGKVVAESTATAAKETANAASLIGYAVAVAAGEIASRIVQSYERELGGQGNSRLAKTAGKKAAAMVDTIRTKRSKAKQESQSGDGE